MLCVDIDPQAAVAISLTPAEWNTVRHCLQDIADSHRAMVINWRDFCNDKKVGAETAARYEIAAAELDRLAKIIEDTLCPPPTIIETE